MTWRWWLNWWLEKGCLHVNWILAFYGVFLFGMAQIFPLLVVKESYRGVWSHKWRVPIKLPSEIPKWQRCLAPQQDTPMPLWKPQTFKYLVCEVSSSCCLQIIFWVVHTNTWLEIWHISSVNIQQHVKRIIFLVIFKLLHWFSSPRRRRLCVRWASGAHRAIHYPP